jgi:hypothetical protein
VTYLKDPKVTQVKQNVSPATLEVSWSFGDQIPDVVRVFWGVPDVGTNWTSDSWVDAPVDKGKQQPTSVAVSGVPSPSVYEVVVVPFLLDANGNLAGELPDDHGQPHAFDWFALHRPITVTGAPQGHGSPPPAPKITKIDRSRGRFVVHWDSDSGVSTFNVRVDSATDQRAPEEIPGGWREYGVDFTEAGVYQFGIEACRGGLLGSKCSPWASTEIVVKPSDDWRTQDVVLDLAAGWAVEPQKDGSQQHLDLITVDANGALILALERPRWEGWMILAGGATASPRSALVLAAQPPNDQLDAFFVAPNGRINVMWVLGHGAWSGASPIHDLPLAPPGAELVAVHQPPNDQLDVFVVDADGALTVLWEVDNRRWQPPKRLTAPDFAPAGGAMAAAQHPPNDQLDVFLVGGDGAVHVLWEVDNGHWQGPSAITGSGFASPGAAICAVRQFPADQLDVFVLGVDGAVHLLWSADNGPWQGPVALTPTGSAVPGTSIAAHADGNEPRLDVAFAGADRRLYTLTEHNNGQWSAATPVSDPVLAPRTHIVMPETGEVYARGASGHFLHASLGQTGWSAPQPVL